MIPEEYTIYYKTWDKIYNCLYEFECKFLEKLPWMEKPFFVYEIKMYQKNISITL